MTTLNWQTMKTPLVQKSWNYLVGVMLQYTEALPTNYPDPDLLRRLGASMRCLVKAILPLAGPTCRN